MDFDTAKENIQPLRQGRRADRLEAVLGHEASRETLEMEKRQHENSIAKYEGPDPLAPWYEYICWIEQSFPQSGNESGLDETVLKCIVAFENDQRYTQDRRMIKLYIKYIDTREDPQEFFSKLYNNGIGTLVADLYIAWSYYYDASNDYKQVEAIFRKGFDAGAKPKDELEQAHHAFGVSMSRRLLYDDDGSRREFKEKMEEKRSALTSLRAYKNKFVGSLRTGIAVRDENPGTVNQENVPTFRNLQQPEVHEDDQQGAVALPPSTSVIRSIIDSARKKENSHEPGPWTKAKVGQHGNLFGEGAALHQPGFNIMEDDNLPPLPCPVKTFDSGINLPPGFVSRNEPQKPWNVPMCVEEPVVPGAVPCYEKFLLYPNKRTEISADEYRAYKWFKDRGMTAPVTHEYERFWVNKFETPMRIPPGFVAKNAIQEHFSTELFIDASEPSSALQMPFGKMYPGNGEVFSFEELKFMSGNFKLLTDDDFEEVNSSDMEMTMIGDRRQSIYPASRKSFVPRKSVMVMKEVGEEEEEPVKKVHFEESSGAIRKRKMTDEMDDKRPQLKRESVAASPHRGVFEKKKDMDIFKPPAPVDRKSIKPFSFELPDDDCGNDTCSTVQFNFFLKAQSVSTPVSKKSVPRLVPLEMETEKTGEPVNDTQMPVDQVPKQLSTIMETTETTHSTKSSVSSANDTDLNPKTPKFQRDSDEREAMQQEIEKRIFNPMLSSFRLPEDQTETCAKIQPVMLQRVADVTVTQARMAESMRAIDFAEPAFEIYEDDKEDSMTMTTGSEDKDVSMKMLEEKQAKEESFKLLEKENDLPGTSAEVPETQEENSASFNIPATQEVDQESFSIPETQEIDVPATQIPDDVNIPATQDPPQPDVTSKNDSIPFNIYEDSVREPPQLQQPLKMNIADDEGTGFLHMSRKENLFVPPPVSVIKKTASDEFLELLASPGSVKKNEVSDLLKFSGVSGVGGALEASLKRLSIDQPKSATPTNFFDEDLNTERFSSALGNLKNSTLLMDVRKPTPILSSGCLDLSIDMTEDEKERLGAAAEFKVPTIPPPKPLKFEDADDDGDEMGKSIYVPRPELQEEEVGDWSEGDLMGSFVADPFNKYEHSIMSDHFDSSLKVQEAIASANGNPFDENLREAMLEHCNFSSYLESHVKTCTLVKTVPQLKSGMVVDCGADKFRIAKFIARGSFASVFAAKNLKTSRLVAMKQEKPANLWEFYICLELADRIKDKKMLAAFMCIEAAVIGNNCSVFITQLSTHGSIIDVCNRHKSANNKNIDEYVVMVLTTQLLSIIDHLHGCKIIHADIKPDNFVLMSKIEFGMKIPAIQLIDFGAAIDMDWYKKNDVFTYVVKTENFTCCEMQEAKPWTYQADLFGLAGTSFVMLFGRYMEVEKPLHTWSVKAKFPRYINKTLWEHFFLTLLNIESCEMMPNLQTLKDQFEEEIHAKEKFVRDKITEFNCALQIN